MPFRVGSQSARARLLPAIVLLLGATAPFVPALAGDFVYDDFPAILKNPRVTGGPALAIFTSGSYWREGEVGYRPLATLSFRVSRSLWGERPAAFHATNMFLHAANALLVGAVASALLGGSSWALVAALLFAVHPAQVESVAGIAAGRAELLAAGFALGALVLAVRAPGREVGPARSVLIALLYFAALLSKESALPLPLLILFVRGARGESGGRALGSRGSTPFLSREGTAFPSGGGPAPPSRWAQRILFYVLLGAALGAYLALRHAALGRLGALVPAFLDNPIASADAGAFPPAVLRVLSEYARLLVFPLRLSADYGYNAVPLPTSIGSPSVVPGIALAVVVAGLSGFAWLRSGDARAPLLALAFAATLVLPLHLLMPLPALCAERFLYFPIACAALLVGALATGGRRQHETPRPPRSPALALALAVLALFAARSAARSREWRSERALFEASARATPGSARAHNVLGLAYRNAGSAAEAEAEFRSALAIYPEYGSALVNLGNLELERGEVKSARARYEAALAQNPGFERARWNLAVALERLGDMDGATRQYATLAAADTTHFDARLRLGEILMASGRAEEARRAFEEALRIRPGDVRALRDLERLEGSQEPP